MVNASDQAIDLPIDQRRPSQSHIAIDVAMAGNRKDQDVFLHGGKVGRKRGVQQRDHQRSLAIFLFKP
jgi:hypothetical protein